MNTTIIERIKRHIKSAAIALFVLATSSAWADVAPAAVWESDFGVQKTRGAYTLTLPADSWVDSDGNLNIASGDTSAKISFTGGGSAISVLMEYENAVANSAKAGMIPIIVNPNNTGNQFGVKVYEDGSLGLSGTYQTGIVYPKSGTRVMTTMPKSGVLLFSMPNGSACSVYSATTREGLTATDAGSSINGLLFSNSTLTQIGLGGPVAQLNYISNFTGLKIKKVAIFKSAISASDAAAYVFPSERSFDYSATVTSANTTWTDISWDNGATWDDAADNTSKSVYLKFADGASVVRNGGLAAGSVYLHGAGSLNFTDSAGTEATVSSAIGGIGSVIAQSGTIKFTGANTFLGGLTVKSGAIATTTSTSGFGAKDCTVTVENGGAADIAKTGASTYKFVIEGTGVNNSGALYSTEAIGGGSKQAQSIALTGDATITVGANWGIINDGYAAASLSLGTHTLTKKGVGRFWICNTTISGTGTIKVESGFLDTISNSYTSNGASAKIKICSGATMFIGGDSALDGLNYTFGNLSIGNLEIDAGGNVTVASGRTLTVTGSLVSNGTITDNGTIVCSGTISGTDQSIAIASGATFTWQNQAWSSGDYFTGAGTLELSVNSGLKEMSATSNFSGILKLTGSKNDNNYPVIGNSSGDAENIFTGMPELILNGYMGLQNAFVGKSFSVRNFSDTSVDDRIRMNKFTSSSSIKTIKTKQTKDTIVKGRFQYSTTGPTYSALTVYGDDNATGIHSLTLSGANDTLGPLTVQNNAKVILATGGKWAGPTTVENGGFLEAKHTSAPLAALTLNAGATIVIPSSTTTTGTGDEAVTTATTTPITASGAITFSGSGVVNVDLSNAAISEGNAATVIMTGASIANITSENVDEIFQETSGDYKFTIDGNSVKAQNIGTCTWTGSAWDGDPADYNEVVVNVDAGGTTLTLDRAYSFRRVTLSGSAGTLTISGAGSITTDELIIPSGVTMTATSLISTLVISGDGTLNIPLGTTYTMNGVTCSAQVTCAGKLITQGTTVLSNSTSTYSGEVVVESGITDFNSAQKGVTGKITIDSGATFRTDFDQWDHLDYEGTCEVHVYGTINFKNVWSVGANNTFYFYNGCTISGQGNTHISSIDWVGAKVYVKADKNGGTGTVTFPVTSRLRANTTIEVDEGMTFTMNGPLNSSTGTGFGFTKQGGGVFNFTPSSTASFTGTTTVAAGQMIMTSDPTFGTIQIDESAVFTLRSDLNGSTTYTGTGTLELENLSGNKWYLQNTAFAGKIKTKNSGSNYWIGGANANGGQAPLFSGYPELIAESGQQLLNRNFNGQTLPVRDLSGNATFYVGNVDTDADRATRTVSTKQTKNTTFGGLFKSYNDCTTSLSVYGEDSANVYALTLTGASTSAGGLTVSTYAKVVFSDAGSWHNGLVTVGANGYLESTNAAAVTKLTLQDGAHIVFPAATSSLGGISELAFAMGTTYISFPDGVTPTDGATLIDWSTASLEAAPAGEFKLEGTAAESYVLTKSATGLVISKSTAFASITDNGNATFCQNAIELAQAVSNAADTYDFVTILGNGEVSLYWLDGLKIKNPNNAAISFIGLGSDCSLSTAMEGGVTTYTKSPVPTAYTWTGQAKQTDPENLAATIPDPAWTKARNWQYTPEGDATTTATRYPQAGDTVIFDDGATVTLDADATVAGMVVNGAVSISASQKSLNLTGNVTGDGTLTLSDVCMANANGGGITVAPAVHFTNDSELAGDNALTLNGDVAISDTFKVWNSNHAINGNVTINSGVTFKYGALLLINGAATVKGAFTRDAGSTNCIKFCGAVTIENGNVSIDGWQSGNLDDAATVVLAGSGASLTDTRGNPITDNKVSTTVADSYVKKSGNTYSVAAKRTATVSVGTNASLSINGNAVADGDTLKFVPGDVLTITASADTYYTPALTVNEVTQTSPYQLTTTDADVTVSATATRDTVAITIPSVDNTTVSVSYTSGGAAQVAATAGDITVDAGTDVTAAWTAASGYRITSGASQTLIAVASAQALTGPTVEEMSAVVSNVNFTYGADYTTAEVTATIAGEATSATLTYGSNTYNAQVSNGTVTFTDVVVSRDSGNIYAPVSYTITTDAHATTGGAGSAVVADTTSWFSQSSANSGVPVNGSWTTPVNLSTPTNVTDNTFTTTESTSSRVVLEFNVCFSSVSDADVDGDAQGALKLGEVNSVTTFMVLTNGNQWAAVSNVGLTPDPTATNKVVMTFDYANNTYSVSVDNYELTDGSGSSSFPLAASRTGVKDIDFAGTGTLVSMKGDQVEGYMVVDKNGTRYPSIAAAISAYTQDPSIGPLKLLHAGTAPSGWRIDGDTLIKAAKGLFFMAF